MFCLAVMCCAQKNTSFEYLRCNSTALLQMNTFACVLVIAFMGLSNLADWSKIWHVLLLILNIIQMFDVTMACKINKIFLYLHHLKKKKNIAKSRLSPSKNKTVLSKIKNVFFSQATFLDYYQTNVFSNQVIL